MTPGRAEPAGVTGWSRGALPLIQPVCPLAKVGYGAKPREGRGWKSPFAIEKNPFR